MGAFLVANSHYRSSNDDSKYYSSLVERYQNASWSNVVAPLWGENYYSYAPNTYMRDQLPGQLIMGVIISKLGVPAEHALHILEMAFQILSIFFLVKIAEVFLASDKASSIYYGVLLTPMAFSYNLRGNHEMGVMFFCLLSLYAGLKLSKSIIWSLVSIFACVMLLMIKGPFFIFGLILFFVGFYFSEERTEFKRVFFSLILSALAVFFTGYLFEYLYVKITGISFFSEFYKIQIQQRAMTNVHKHFFLIQKFLNFYYYFVNYFSYSLPWCLWAFVVLIKNRKNTMMKNELYQFLKSRLSLCLLASAFIFCFVFSVSDRTASRYIFPAYYLFSAWSVLLVLQISKTFQELHKKILRFGVHSVAALVWFIALVLHFI